MNAVSPWVQRWSHLVAGGSTVLDVACGSGRHVHWFAARGCLVVALDRDAAAVASLSGVAAEAVVADIEGGSWPLSGRRFDAVVVTNYLHRPLMPLLVDSVAPGGTLFYETFGRGQAGIGRPSNPEFLLRQGELLQLVEPLRVIAFEDGYDPGEQGGRPARFVQRIIAVRAPEDHDPALPQFHRYLLEDRAPASG